MYLVLILVLVVLVLVVLVLVLLLLVVVVVVGCSLCVCVRVCFLWCDLALTGLYHLSIPIFGSQGSKAICSILHLAL